MPRPSQLGLTVDDSVVYGFRVPRSLRDAWKAYTKEHGDTAQEALRAVMRHLLKQGSPNRPMPAFSAPKTVKTVLGRPDRAPKKRVEVQLTQSEYATLAEIAEGRECSVQFWLVGLIRAVLTRAPVFGITEARALGESNYQLMAIGRNLNQIAHQINADPGRSLHRLKLEQIEALSARIDEHRKHVAALIEACSERWEIR